MNDLLIHNQPHSEEAEDKLIATCLIDGDSSVYDSVSQVLDVDDFYTLRGKLVFQALGEMAAAGESFEDLTLMERLKASKGLDEVGGIAGIMAMAGRACMVSQVDYYTNVVLEKSKLRELMRSCRLAVEQAESEAITYEVIRSNLETEITARPSQSVNEASISNSAEELIEEIKQMQEGTYVPDVVKTHLGRLDDLLGNRGIAAGEVLTLAAPTSCGKSALALYIASQSVAKDNTSCAIFSLEMPQKQLTKRLLQVVSGVNMMTILDNTANDSEKQRVHEATNKLKNDMPIFTSHSVKSADDLVSQTRQFVQKNGVKLVIIDYLQLIPFSPKMGKAEGIASISHKIKQMALDLNIAVILLAQVNREGAKRGPLELYDLKDSGDIENDADVVLLMYPSNGDVESSKDTDYRGAYTNLSYKLAKNREGERGIGCFFKFYHCTGRFD